MFMLNQEQRQKLEQFVDVVSLKKKQRLWQLVLLKMGKPIWYVAAPFMQRTMTNGHMTLRLITFR